MSPYNIGDHPEHRAALPDHANLWIENALSTEPADQPRAREAIRGLYEAANLEPPPREVFVASPLTAHIAGGVAAGIWWLRHTPQEHDALFGRTASEAELMAAIPVACRGLVERGMAALTGDPVAARRAVDPDPEVYDAAAWAATDDAVGDATDGATYGETYSTIYVATSATRSVLDSDTRAAVRVATHAVVHAATRDTRDATSGAADAATYDVTEDADADDDDVLGKIRGSFRSAAAAAASSDVTATDPAARLINAATVGRMAPDVNAAVVHDGPDVIVGTDTAVSQATKDSTRDSTDRAVESVVLDDAVAIGNFRAEAWRSADPTARLVNAATVDQTVAEILNTVSGDTDAVVMVNTDTAVVDLAHHATRRATHQAVESVVNGADDPDAIDAAARRATDPTIDDVVDYAARAATMAAIRAAVDLDTWDDVGESTADVVDVATDRTLEMSTHAAVQVAMAASVGFGDAARDATSGAVETSTRIATSGVTDDATDDATTGNATRFDVSAATSGVTDMETHVATDNATRTAVDAAIAATGDPTSWGTRDATYSAADVAIVDATNGFASREVVQDGTEAATDHATLGATSVATNAAVDAAINGAIAAITDDATRGATIVATRDAAIDIDTHSVAFAAVTVATRNATDDATDNATRTAVDAAIAATGDPTSWVTRDATESATDVAIADATDVSSREVVQNGTDRIVERGIRDATRTAVDDPIRAAAPSSPSHTAARTAVDDGALPWFLALCARYAYRMHNGGSDWSAWPSYLSFFDRVAGLDLPIYPKWRHYEQAALTAASRIMHTRFWVASDRQTSNHRDDQARLHNPTGPARTWADGWALWYWHGVRVPRSLIEDGWDTARILLEPNAEIRRCAIEKIGWPRFIQDSDFQPVGPEMDDPGNPGQTIALYDVPELIYGEPRRILIVTNGTIEPDGSRRQFGILVPGDIPTPLHAQAWIVDDPDHPVRMTPDRYAQMSRRT